MMIVESPGILVEESRQNRTFLRMQMNHPQRRKENPQKIAFEAVDKT